MFESAIGDFIIRAPARYQPKGGTVIGLSVHLQSCRIHGFSRTLVFLLILSIIAPLSLLNGCGEPVGPVIEKASLAKIRGKYLGLDLGYREALPTYSDADGIAVKVTLQPLEEGADPVVIEKNKLTTMLLTDSIILTGVPSLEPQDYSKLSVELTKNGQPLAEAFFLLNEGNATITDRAGFDAH